MGDAYARRWPPESSSHSRHHPQYDQYVPQSWRGEHHPSDVPPRAPSRPRADRYFEDGNSPRDRRGFATSTTRQFAGSTQWMSGEHKKNQPQLQDARKTVSFSLSFDRDSERKNVNEHDSSEISRERLEREIAQSDVSMTRDEPGLQEESPKFSQRPDGSEELQSEQQFGTGEKNDSTTGVIAQPASKLDSRMEGLTIDTRGEHDGDLQLRGKFTEIPRVVPS